MGITEVFPCPRLVTCVLFFVMLSWSAELGIVASSALQQGMSCASRICNSPHPSDDSSKPHCEIPADSSRCPGKCCANTDCSECRQLPECKEGEELRCSGKFDFMYRCISCPNGTYLDSKTHCCVPWTDCKTIGLKVLQPGDRIHNVKCGPDPMTIILQPDSPLTTILAVLTAAGIFVLILMTCSLLVCTWLQKTEKLPVEEEPELGISSNLQESQRLHEDTFSCQFPEEELGEKWQEASH